MGPCSAQEHTHGIHCSPMLHPSPHGSALERDQMSPAPFRVRGRQGDLGCGRAEMSPTSCQGALLE